jgi:hypothetical protein
MNEVRIKDAQRMASEISGLTNELTNFANRLQKMDHAEVSIDDATDEALDELRNEIEFLQKGAGRVVDAIARLQERHWNEWQQVKRNFEWSRSLMEKPGTRDLC